MGMTIGEKIIARAAGLDKVKPNDIHTVTLDRMMSNDGTTHLTVDMYNNQLQNPSVADPDKVVFIMDHNIPAESPKTAQAHKKCGTLPENTESNVTKAREYATRSCWKTMSVPEN